MKIFLKSLTLNYKNIVFNFVDKYFEADIYSLPQFIFVEDKLKYKTIYLDNR